MTAPTLPQIALAEFTRRRQIATRKASEGAAAEAQRHVRLWCGIAAWFGAVLPDDCRPFDGWQLFTDHAPRDFSVAQWTAALAAELRRAALAQLAVSEQDPQPHQLTRARGLLALDHELSLAAGLPPIGADQPTPQKEAT